MEVIKIQIIKISIIKIFEIHNIVIKDTTNNIKMLNNKTLTIIQIITFLQCTWKNLKRRRKKSILPVILTAIVTFIVLVGALYFGYNKFLKKENIVDLSRYEVNFVTYGVEGEGKPEADIKKFQMLQILLQKSQTFYLIQMLHSISKVI